MPRLDPSCFIFTPPTATAAPADEVTRHPSDEDTLAETLRAAR